MDGSGINAIQVYETRFLNFKDVVVSKPWGEEFLVYENDLVALWLLYIKHNENTSLHCHPLKTTGMVLLSGEIELSFLADKRILNAPSKAMIRRGLFHSTKALSKEGAFLFEIETPNDKLDLIRLDDNYGRQKLGYETSNNYKKRGEDNLTIVPPRDLEIKKYSINGVEIEVFKVETLNTFKNARSDQIYIFLDGGMGKYVSKRKHLVTVPGDVAYGNILAKIAKNMDFVASNTLVIKFGEQ